MTRAIGFVGRKDGITHEEFRERHRKHVPVVEEPPNSGVTHGWYRSFRRRVRTTASAYLWFDDPEDCRAAFDSPAGDRQFEHAERFAEPPEASDPNETAGENILSMVFETQVDVGL